MYPLMNKYTIDDALASFDNFIGYEGEAPTTESEYENLIPLENYTEVFEGKKPEWIEVLSRKIELETYKDKKIDNKISAYKKLGLTDDEIDAIM
tara:strand:- start:1826 stop:2107 length:282 start_codon:yes stop_codon:yes gene_type:complete